MPRAGWLCGKAGYAQQCLECKDKLAVSVQFKVVQCLFHLASNKICHCPQHIIASDIAKNKLSNLASSTVQNPESAAKSALGACDH